MPPTSKPNPEKCDNALFDGPALKTLTAGVARVVGLQVPHRTAAERIVEAVFAAVEPDQATAPVTVFQAMLRTLQRLPPIAAPRMSVGPAALQALRGVPLESQVALALTCWEGLGACELAMVLDCPRTEVDARLTRARDLLRDQSRASTLRARYDLTMASSPQEGRNASE